MDRGARLNAVFGYAPDDRARYAAEDAKRAQFGVATRDDFARDRARILHSYAFRRLADKTQVVSPGQDDFPRTRLTHSLEVAQIAREIGGQLGCAPDITDAAGLAHDLGHPPFGHNGEEALNRCAAGIGGFEGNAQTLRILTRLEAKAVEDDGAPVGLNLSRAVLDATCKYPWPARPGQVKFGVYGDDLDVFRWLRAGRPDGERCLEAEVMDWADDVAYSVHDVEDGVHAGHVRLDELGSDGRAELCREAARLYSASDAADLAPALDRLLALPALAELAGYDGSLRAQARAKRATSELTGRFCGAAVAATRAKYGDQPLGRYTAELVVPADVAAECALLKAIAYHYVMRRPEVEPLQTEQRRLLTELTELLFAGGRAVLAPALVQGWDEAGSDDERLRVVIDQVAQLTDSAATSWHTRLTQP